jgi:hypothetical protein
MSATGWLPLVAAALLVQAGCASDHSDYGYAVSPASASVAKKPSAKRVPSPDQALLAPQRKPDCESGAAIAETAHTPEGAQPASSASDAGVDMALRIKLEYERECYKQAEIRARERLLRLQAWTAETVKASDR